MDGILFTTQQEQDEYEAAATLRRNMEKNLAKAEEKFKELEERVAELEATLARIREHANNLDDDVQKSIWKASSELASDLRFAQ